MNCKIHVISILTMILLFNFGNAFSQNDIDSTIHCKYYQEYDNGEKCYFLPLIFSIDGSIPTRGTVKIINFRSPSMVDTIEGNYNTGQVLLSKSDYETLLSFGDSVKISLVFEYRTLLKKRSFKKNHYEWALSSGFLFSSVIPYVFLVENYKRKEEIYKTEIHHASKSSYYIDRKIYNVYQHKKDKRSPEFR